MAYIITVPNHSSISVQPGTVDTSATSLALVGKNLPGYGQYINQNFVDLLTNFENTTAPANPIIGQLWWDSGNGVLKVFNGGVFKNASGVTSSPNSSPPTAPLSGDLWYDTTNGQVKVYTGTIWQVVGPDFTSGQGKSGVFTETITDTGNVTHSCSVHYITGIPVAIVSTDAAFFPNPTISGFAQISPGLNLTTTVYGGGTVFAVNTVNATTITGNLTGNVNGTSIGGTLTTAAQPNVTSLGNLTSATTVGNVTVGNALKVTNGATVGSLTTAGAVSTGALSSTTGTFSGNVSGPGGNFTNAAITTSLSAATLRITGNTSLNNLNVTGTVTGTITNAGSAGTATTVTGNAQPNITSVGTLTGLNVNGVAAINGSMSANSVIATDGFITNVHTSNVIQDTVATAVGTSATTFYQFASASYRAAKLVVSSYNGTSGLVTAVEALVIHDGTTAFITTYNLVSSGATQITLSAVLTGGNVVVQATGSATNNQVRVQAILIPV